MSACEELDISIKEIHIHPSPHPIFYVLYYLMETTQKRMIDRLTGDEQT